jgi:hypothetical protein
MPDVPEGFGGFSFAEPVKPMTVSEAAKAVSKAMGERRIFEVSAEGYIKIHGYSADDTLKLLVGYRDHMVELGRMAQGIQASADAVRYAPGEGGYQ